MEALAALEHHWQTLFANATGHSAFQSLCWLRSWWQTLGRPAGWHLYVVTVYEHDEPVLFWPLVHRRSGIWRVATWPAAETGQYGDMLCRRGEDHLPWIDAAWEFITRRSGFDIITLPAVRTNSCLGRFLEQKRIPAQETAFAPVFDISTLKDPQQWEQLQKRGFRKDLRRRRRRLAELGEVRFELLGNADDIANAIPVSIQQKQAWFEARKLYGRFIEHQRASEWLTRAALGAQADDRLVYAVLKLDDRIIASNLGFVSHGRLYNYFGSFDLDLQRYSPGNILTQDLLQWAIDNGIEQFDLMPPNDAYKSSWANSELAVSSYRLGIGPKGRIADWCYHPALRSIGLRSYRALPRSLRKVAAQWLGG